MRGHHHIPHSHTCSHRTATTSPSSSSSRLTRHSVPPSYITCSLKILVLFLPYQSFWDYWNTKICSNCSYKKGEAIKHHLRHPRLVFRPCNHTKTTTESAQFPIPYTQPSMNSDASYRAIHHLQINHYHPTNLYCYYSAIRVYTAAAIYGKVKKIKHTGNLYM